MAREVSRVLKQGGYFLGLIAFIQPWHGDSYYHFSHLGVKQMLDEIKFKIIDIKPGDINGVSYLIQCLFPKPIGFIGNILFWGRKKLTPLIIKIIYLKNQKTKEKKLKFLKKDNIRFAASIIYLSQKPII